MKQIICYLYENQNNKQVKNIGFIKCIFMQGKVTFQIHGKGMMCNRTMGLEMFLFTGKAQNCEVRRIGIVEGNQGMVNYCVVLEEESYDFTEVYDGIILKAQNDTIYVGTWNRKEYNFTTSWIDKKEEYKSDNKNDKVLDKVEELEVTVESSQKIYIEKEVVEEVVEEMVEDIVEEIIDKKVDTMYMKEKELGSKDNVQEEAEITYEKLDRQDLAKFPQREWKLASNNFLIHGYMNFRHIMCIREEDRTYIGVPGVYYQREAEMAKTFGFPTFHRPKLNKLNLDEQECSRGEDFGYWCRPISVRKDIE